MMNFSEEWKSLWPISSIHSPPLLLSPAAVKRIGPLIFNPSPKPQTHHLLFNSSSVSPQIPPPFPNLSLSRFLHASSSILPSTTTSIASQISSSSSNIDRLLAHNSLQLLRCPGTNTILAFFPTGSNSDQVGFVVLSVENSQLKVGRNYGETEVFTSNNAWSHRIVKISVNLLADCDNTSGDSVDSTIAYMLVCTNSSVYYYDIRIRTEGSGKITPGLELLGHKLFKSSAVVHACWSPHLPEESLVLLESSDLFLFDLGSCFGPSITSPRLIGRKLKVLWDLSVISEKGGWLSCDFSWHPRVLIVVHSSIVFLVDSRSEKCKVIILLTLGPEGVGNDKFVAFSTAAPDHFYFTLASNHMVFLCDLRKPMIPLLRWIHNVANPSYIIVLKLSELRSLSQDVMYSWASEVGYGIILGSFWNCEFSLFCYGTDARESVSSQVSSCSKSFYAWGLPSDLSLVTRECRCGCCVVKGEFCKDILPRWISWLQKKEFVLGFGILDSEISSQLFEPEKFGGFTLITLTSTGNLELHRYCASWDYSQTLEKGHTDQALDLEDSVLYETGDEEYKFRKSFQYLKFEWLDGYLKSDLARILSRELIKNLDNGSPKKAYFGKEFHENICQTLNMFGSGGSQRSLNVHDVFSDISLPTSIHEIALRSVWSNLPKKVLRLGFSTYSDLPEVPAKLKHVPFEFLEVPCHQCHLPPFFFRFPSFRSSKWSDKQKPNNCLVGPVIPIPFLMTFHKARMLKTNILSADSEIDLECDEVMRVTNEVTGSTSLSCNGNAVSLADNNDDVFNDSQNLQTFASYKPVALSSKLSKEDQMMEDSVFEDEKHTNVVFGVGQKDVNELFESSCPLKFKFAEHDTSFGTEEMKAYKLLKRQYSNFKDGFRSYQDYMTKFNIHSILNGDVLRIFSGNDYQGYLGKYGIILAYPGERLLLLTQSHNARNLLVDFNNEGILLGKKIRAESCKVNTDMQRYYARIPPELLAIIDARIDVVKSFYLLPSLMHRLESLMLASQLRQEITGESTDLRISSLLILEAIMTLRCNKSFSMELLELLGDSLLKYAVSCDLYLKYPKKHEGQLSSRRSWQVCNSTLYDLGISRHLQGYIRDIAFDPTQWTAPGQLPLRLYPFQHGVETIEVPIERKYQSEDPKNMIGKCCDMGHRWMISKTVSDCVEALVGAYYVSGGLIGALHCMKWLGVSCELDPSCIDEAIKIASLHTYAPKLSVLELKIGYEFVVKGLLLEAITLTHASNQEHRYCYQDIVLGDSVLLRLSSKSNHTVRKV